MQIVDDGTPTQIEEILAHAAIERPSSLSPAHMGQSMFDSSPFTQFGPSLWGLLQVEKHHQRERFGGSGERQTILLV
jgi:hypothetical protein